MKNFNYENGMVYYNTKFGERNAIVVSVGDYYRVKEVEEEFDRYLKTRDGACKDAEDRKGLFTFVLHCSNGLIK